MDTATIYPKSYRLNVRIPDSITEVIDKILEYRVADGESSVSRTSIALELLKIGARIKEKELEKKNNPIKEDFSKLDEQLSFINDQVVRTKLKIDAFFNIMVEQQNISDDLIHRIISQTKLLEGERELLYKLFKKPQY